jgi:hypothetical protein
MPSTPVLLNRAFRPSAALSAAVLLVIAGCASGPDAQWVDPQLAGKSFAGGKVLVVCDAYEPAVKQICRDQLAQQVTQRGGHPVFGPELATTSPWKPVTPEQLLPAARSAGAVAVLSAVVQPGLQTTRPGPSIGFGLGGFSFGGGGGGGVGVGISTPIGGGRAETSYGADGVITDVSSGRLVWTAKVSASPSNDVASQIGVLAKELVEAAGKSGLL